MSSKPIKYFFHDGCPHCIRFSKALNQSPKTVRNQIESLSVADTRTKALIASKYPQVETVPTIVLPGGETLTGNDAFSWLENQIPEGVERMPMLGNNLITKVVVGSLLAAAIWFFYIKKKNKVAGL